MAVMQEQRGFTAPSAAPGQDVSRLKKRELDKHLAGLQAQDVAPPAWMELYDALLDERDEEGRRRWDWRKALFSDSLGVAESAADAVVLERKAFEAQGAVDVYGRQPGVVRGWVYLEYLEAVQGNAPA